MSFTDPDAHAVVRAILDRYGLGELSDWAWDRITDGASVAELELELRETPQFRQRFRAIFEREARGLPAISPEQVLDYERERRAVLRAYGFPDGFYDDPDDAVAGLVNDVSVAELEQRAAMWVDYTESQYAPEVRSQLARLYGVGSGSLAAFLMDEERALPVIQRQVASSDIAARAARHGFDLSAVEAERVREMVDPQDASARFAALERTAGILGDRLGDQAAGLSRDDLIGVAAADPQALQRAERRVARARGAFEQTSGASATNRGIGGLGTAT